MALSDKGRFIGFRNPKTGELREYSYNWVACLLLGFIYLGYKGWWKMVVRMVVAQVLWLALCYVIASVLGFAGLVVRPLVFLSTLFYTDGLYGGSFGFLSYVGLIVVYVWLVLRLPEMEVKDLFASGFAPHSSSDWQHLGASGILGASQLSSYEQVWKEPQGVVEEKPSGDSGRPRVSPEMAVEPGPASGGASAANGSSKPSIKLEAPRVGCIADDGLREVLCEAGWKARKDFYANEDGSVNLSRKGVHTGACVPLLNSLGFDGESVRSRIRGSMVPGGGRFSAESDRFLVEWSIAKDGGLEKVSVRPRT